MLCNACSKLRADGADKGIIPLTTSELFRRVEHRSEKDANLFYTVEVSYIEIYNEK
jgi:kinesin family protein 1